MKKYLSLLLSAVGAGFCVGVGGVVYLSCKIRGAEIAGALLFACGLLTILIFGFSLYTGALGYTFENLQKKNFAYLLQVLVIWAGNYLGASLMAGLILLTRNASLSDAAESLAQVKVSDKWFSLLVLGFLCGVLMFIAVDVFKKRENGRDFLPTVMVFVAIAVFILSGFEHSIADMFYFTLSGHFAKTIPALLLITAGNFVGGNFIPVLLFFKNLLAKETVKNAQEKQ